MCVRVGGEEGQLSWCSLHSQMFDQVLFSYLQHSIAKTASKKIGALIRSVKFLSPEVALYLCKSTIRHVWNTVVISGLVLLVATWNC